MVNKAMENDIRRWMRMAENVGSDGSSEALVFIGKAARKFGRARLSGGNCGTFALALATRLKEIGLRPTIAFIYRWHEEENFSNVDDLVGSEPDIYHVVVMLGDRMFDASGETNVNALLTLTVREYRDREPSLLRDIGMDEPAVHTLIEEDTNWSITSAAFLVAMKS